MMRPQPWRIVATFVAGLCYALAVPSAVAIDKDDLVSRVRNQASDYLEQFAQVKCTEKVNQEKLNSGGKVELQRDSTYDYLVILSDAGGEISLDESRLAVGDAAKLDKKNRPLLVSNGFATLFLIFHPYYADSFEFSAGETENLNGQRVQKVSFRHLRGTRSPAALSVRGREYPLELFGTAWIDPQTATIAKIEADVGNSMEDVGLKALRSEIHYAPVVFHDMQKTYWFPVEAVVEVETQRQHWRNTHMFSDYKRFAVSTEEQVANK
jgi:hypothetical protein